MRNLNEIKERYLKEPMARQLGHLASDLLRISNFIDNPVNAKVVEDMIEESKFFIEWAAPDAPLHIQEALLEIQPKLALWQLYLSRRKDNPKDRVEFKESARNWSLRLLNLSGLNTA